MEERSGCKASKFVVKVNYINRNVNRVYSGLVVVTYIHSADLSSVEATGVNYQSSFNRQRPTTFYNSILFLLGLGDNPYTPTYSSIKLF